MMLRYSLKLEDEARFIESAADQAIADGARTKDLGGTLTTRQMTDEVIRIL
jgi:3-isopropylmalate dehydrogenase